MYQTIGAVIIAALSFVFGYKRKKTKDNVDIRKIDAETEEINIHNIESTITIYERAMELLQRQVFELEKKVEILDKQQKINISIIAQLQDHMQICDAENKQLKKRVSELEKGST